MPSTAIDASRGCAAWSVGGGEPELREPRGGADREDQVLRVHPGEQQAETERLPRRERIDARHPLWHRGLGAPLRPASPLAHGEQREEAPSTILPHEIVSLAELLAKGMLDCAIT